MIELIDQNFEYNYRVYRSDVIVKHQSEMLKRIYDSHKNLMNHYSKLNKNSTWLYRTYNIFSLTGGSEHFYDLYKDLIDVIKLYLPNEKNYWFMSWLNFHKQNEVLNWHNHICEHHGYISIDPKKTITQFENYSIKNEVGNIYIGPGYRKHKVNLLEKYDGQRITLGFDLITKPNEANDLLSLIPII